VVGVLERVFVKLKAGFVPGGAGGGSSMCWGCVGRSKGRVVVWGEGGGGRSNRGRRSKSGVEGRRRRHYGGGSGVAGRKWLKKQIFTTKKTEQKKGREKRQRERKRDVSYWKQDAKQAGEIYN
jgi:hypothetical protein